MWAILAGGHHRGQAHDSLHVGMSNPGMGAMLHYLGGGSPKNPSDYYGRKIAKAERIGEVLRLTFDDGVAIQISDEAQSCCESRFMRTDDNLGDLVGKTLVAIETNSAKSEAETKEGEYGDMDEAVFLDIKTNDQVISFSFHNQHNGYYGGFGLSLAEVT